MTDNVIPFKRPDLRKKARGKTLCRSDFHKWVVVTERQFDVKQGKLDTLYRCSRCNKEKVTAH